MGEQIDRTVALSVFGPERVKRLPPVAPGAIEIDLDRHLYGGFPGAG